MKQDNAFRLLFSGQDLPTAWGGGQDGKQRQQEY